MSNKISVAKNWLQKSSDDVLWTEANLREEVFYGACFTAHQAVEKALKAFLLANEKTLRKIHDLGALLEECIQIDKDFEIVREDVLPMVDYYVQTRYPDIGEFIDYTQEKAAAATASCRKVFEFVLGKINKLPNEFI